MLISIITPCYNSSKTLRKTYESLLNLKYNKFEWILIDDFSQDEGKTIELIKELSNEAPFVVKYKFLPKNYLGSKSTYEGAMLADGIYACILDHDDQLLPDALNIVTENLSSIKIDELAGLCGRCVNEKGFFIGDKFYFDKLISNEGEVRFKMRIRGEMLQFTRVEILIKYFKKMKPGYSNGYIWANISKLYSYVYVNNCLRIYDTSNLESISNSKHKLVPFYENIAEERKLINLIYSKYWFYNPILGLRAAASCINFYLLAKKNIIELFRQSNTKIEIIFYLIALSPAFIFYMKQRIYKKFKIYFPHKENKDKLC
jgi:glycosyltransferase involved in cell wall biosynthesis